MVYDFEELVWPSYSFLMRAQDFSYDDRFNIELRDAGRAASTSAVSR